MKKIVTESSEETKKLGAEFACNLQEGEIICLSGNLGSGKTTFAQGMLAALGAEGPYTSPTFVIMKDYKISKKIRNSKFEIRNLFHIDAYRIGTNDIINLGWEEIIGNKNNVVIVEWAKRIKEIVPERAVWIKFKWLEENKREIIFES